MVVVRVAAKHLGLLSYAEGLTVQNMYKNRRIQGTVKDNVILFLEHSPVFTVGHRSDVYSKSEESRLKSLGADFHRTNRGGLITFHGPGQLVVYPILHLRDFVPKSGIRRFVDKLEQAVIDTCQHFGVTAERSPHTGVWVGPAKVCAMGLNISRGVTSHGLALNCNVDLRWFDHIVACGIEGKTVTSLSKLTGREISVQDAMGPLVDQLGKHLGRKLSFE